MKKEVAIQHKTNVGEYLLGIKHSSRARGKEGHPSAMNGVEELYSNDEEEVSAPFSLVVSRQSTSKQDKNNFAWKRGFHCEFRGRKKISKVDNTCAQLSTGNSVVNLKNKIVGTFHISIEFQVFTFDAAQMI